MNAEYCIAILNTRCCKCSIYESCSSDHIHLESRRWQQECVTQECVTQEYTDTPALQMFAANGD